MLDGSGRVVKRLMQDILEVHNPIRLGLIPSLHICASVTVVCLASRLCSAAPIDPLYGNLLPWPRLT